MTLVVSKIIDGVLHNTSDSLITDDRNFSHTYQPNMDMFTSILKTAIVHRHLCISYAGTVKVADDCLNEIINKESYTIKWVLEYIRELTRNYKDETEFIVCFIDNGVLRQWKITNGEIFDFIDSLLCIGDPKAIKIFEAKFNELISSGIKESDAMKFAFDTVLADDSIKSIGHVAIRVKSGKRTITKRKSSWDEIIFDYLEGIDSRLTRDITTRKNKEGLTYVPLNPEKDLTGMSLFVTSDANKFGIAVYSLFHKKGLLLCPKLNLKRINFKTIEGETIKSTYQNFLDDIGKKYGLLMSGLVWLPDEWGFKKITNVNSCK